MLRNKNFIKNNRGVGPTLTGTKPLGVLSGNIANIAVGKHKIGSAKWRKQILHSLRIQDIPELRSIIGSLQKPLTPKWRSQRRVRSFRTYSSAIVENTKKKSVSIGWMFEPHVEAAIEAMQKKGTRNQFFLTVVTSIQLTREDAVQAALDDVKQLDSYIRRRVPGAMYILTPEVDVLLAKDIKAGLLPDPGWKTGIPDNQYVYKVHIHAPIYAPKHSIWSLSDVFSKTATGKRSRLYSGSNQVRVIDMYDVTEDGNQIPDVRGCIGYSRKNHFRPPVAERMLEGSAEWLLIADAINTNRGMTRIGGVKKYGGVKKRRMQKSPAWRTEALASDDSDAARDFLPPSYDHLIPPALRPMIEARRERHAMSALRSSLQDSTPDEGVQQLSQVSGGDGSIKLTLANQADQMEKTHDNKIGASRPDPENISAVDAARGPKE